MPLAVLFFQVDDRDDAAKEWRTAEMPCTDLNEGLRLVAPYATWPEFLGWTLVRDPAKRNDDEVVRMLI